MKQSEEDLIKSSNIKIYNLEVSVKNLIKENEMLKQKISNYQQIIKSLGGKNE